jgi:hypothetical protein
MGTVARCRSGRAWKAAIGCRREFTLPFAAAGDHHDHQTRGGVLVLGIGHTSRKSPLLSGTESGTWSVKPRKQCRGGPMTAAPRTAATSPNALRQTEQLLRGNQREPSWLRPPRAVAAQPSSGWRCRFKAELSHSGTAETHSRDRHQRSFSHRPCMRPLHYQDRVLANGWHQVLGEGPVSLGADWRSRP